MFPPAALCVQPLAVFFFYLLCTLGLQCTASSDVAEDRAGCMHVCEVGCAPVSSPDLLSFYSFPSLLFPLCLPPSFIDNFEPCEQSVGPFPFTLSSTSIHHQTWVGSPTPPHRHSSQRSFTHSFLCCPCSTLLCHVPARPRRYNNRRFSHCSFTASKSKRAPNARDHEQPITPDTLFDKIQLDVENPAILLHLLLLPSLFSLSLSRLPDSSIFVVPFLTHRPRLFIFIQKSSRCSSRCHVSRSCQPCLDARPPERPSSPSTMLEAW